MDWDKLRIFHEVAQAGSFTHAAENLNLSQSAISRQIASLEERLKILLFHRHARGLILTEQGELLNKAVREIFAKLAMTEARLSESKERPQGPLKITTTIAFGSLWLTPKIKEFLDLYPDIDLTLLLDDRELDLGMREADIAIRLNPPRQADLIQKHLITLGYRVFASLDYINQYGLPISVEDLDRHKIIIYGEDTKPPVDHMDWLIKAGKPEISRKPILKINSIYGMIQAVQAGLGIAALPDYLGLETRNLLPILSDLKSPSFDAYFVYPEELRHSKRIAVFRDFLMQKITYQHS